MSQYRYYILLLFLGILTHACELSNEIDLELPSGESFPLIEAYLTEGEPMQILAIKSNTLQEPVSINMLWNASVYIISGADSLKMRNLIKVDRNKAYLYNYLLDSIVNSSIEEFCLYIETDEFSPISATCKPVGPVEIEQIALSESMMLDIITCNLETPACNYYQVRCFEYSEGLLQSTLQFEIDHHEKPEGPVEISYPLEFKDCDSIRVNLYRMDAVAFTYHRSISNALNANRDPFTTPSPFLGNITNGRGIFTYMSSDSQTFRF